MVQFSVPYRSTLIVRLIPVISCQLFSLLMTPQYVFNIIILFLLLKLSQQCKAMRVRTLYHPEDPNPTQPSRGRKK